MTNKTPRPEEQEAADVAANDPTLNKGAVDEVVEDYEEADNAGKIDPTTEKEMGKVERATEDITMGIEDAS
ncbi:MAG: hypothetical protein KME06_01330 [Kastovskya adunca ATA6-11-RM4]|jgi:hypothetical protein|nr:hypothetical protein [Kastovskya adunca ATA6-11-RM4]